MDAPPEAPIMGKTYRYMGGSRNTGRRTRASEAEL